jgi:hypothetical protein
LHVSLTLQSAIDMTINNNYNIDLTSLVYFTKDVTCHPQFPQQINPKSIVKVKFVTGVDQSIFGGVLLYHLPREDDTFTNTQLLVIWGYRHTKYHSHVLYSHAWLIEHENTLVWDKDKLKMLHDKYYDQWYTDYDMGPWLLKDNTKLNIEYKSSRGGFEMNIIISEEKRYLSYRKPLWVDPNR